MSVHAWLLGLPVVLAERNGDLDAGVTVTVARPAA
jgi:hypothetical protein